MKRLTPEQMEQARSVIASENGKIGGPARAAALSPKRRKEIARKAAKARWARRTDETGRDGKADQ